MQKKKFDAHIERVLKLMINSIYTNKDIFVRELISNASDAIDKLRYLAIENPSLTNQSDFKISVRIDKDNSILEISDNGIGMTDKELVEYLGTIAHSGTSKFMEALNSGDANLIGQFGVGFYSAFMSADHVEVISRKAGEKKTFKWSSDGENGYEVGKSDEELESHGTKIRCKIKAELQEYLDEYRLKHIIKTYSDHIAFPIELIAPEKEAEIVNTSSAVWSRNKNEIKEEEYKEFYHHVSHLPDDPWMRIHYKAEGNINYTALLYFPSLKPYDLYHPDRKTSVKLYIKRVFITDDSVKLVPEYLRFMRGVVDCEDLPLNISRETVQFNPNLERLQKSLLKKILNELKNKASQDPASYAEFWGKFGEVIKEGLCAGNTEEKQDLLEICRFHSYKQNKLVSLDEYISNMVEGQNDVYFLTGEDIEKLKQHPRLEGFRSRDIDVLLLGDHVDDFWVNVVPQFKNKEMKNIAYSDIDLNQIKAIEEKEETNTEEAVDLCDYFKKVLSHEVRDVVISKKLVDSPACLALDMGSMSIRMEKMLLDQKQLKSASKKILEINPSHKVMKKLSSLINSSDEEAQDLCWMVFDQACIIEGDSVRNPLEFAKRLNKILVA